ncbi:UvrD-helicase domain-containing protein [Marmoricola sp. Leaf446]|uniref:UvrD-helicase domain-containing protein n=1 Tax=Marmoricola sp. Leaf446 TaxID=1736379 RepID=UPI000A8C3844|nr:UvrD-helicase domain-containing protein [Marmoricola sp. Leaf446]
MSAPTAGTPVRPAPTPFDPLGELPTGTALLEASAGTGKTWAVGALVTRYVAEGRARLDELLVITFGRAASQELRERVREQLVAAERALADPVAARAAGGLTGLLAGADDDEVAQRRERLRQALADFDGATIATTHQFCQQVLRSLGVAGDTDTGAELVEQLDDLVVEVVDDLFLARYGDLARPPFTREVALGVARVATGDPQSLLVAEGAEGSPAVERRDFGEAVRAELERRKRRRGVLSYDDLLSRLRDALRHPDSPARARMQHRWHTVLVDEFQDTDPVQWQVLDLAFGGAATMVLIGDPKQAIYAFRGGDVVTYLDAAGTAVEHRTLATNWRSDAPLVDALQALLGGAELGDPRITVHPVAAHHATSRLTGAPRPAPLRLRVVDGPSGESGGGTLSVDAARRHVATDLADDVAALLGSGARHDGEPLQPEHLAVLVYSLRHVELFQRALAAKGVASVVHGGSSVLLTEAGREWLTLLEALEQPHRAARVRSVALGPFVGLTPTALDAGGEDVTDEVGERVRRWLDLVRARGIAAVHEAVVADGLAERVLARPDGERLLTDLHHLGQVLHDEAHREGLGVTGLLEWLRSERRAAVGSNARTRRLDTDARAVQLVTIHASKGLQYPVVYLPLAFNKWVPDDEVPLFHDAEGHRTRDVGGTRDGRSVRRHREEQAGEELRLTYVALTRAQSQVVAWWAPTRDSVNAGWSRLLLGRTPGSPTVATRLDAVPGPREARQAFERWEQAGALVVEDSVPTGAPALPPGEGTPRLDVRRFDRTVDTDWRRTSYSGLIRAEEQAATPGTDGATTETEPELAGTTDERDGAEDDLPATPAPAREDAADLPSPMDGLPAGATLGSLVHGVLEHADPAAPDLLAELELRVEQERRWWAVETPTPELAQALLPSQHTPLGPLVGDRTLADIGLRDRLRELDFEIPLAGGDRPGAQVPLAAMADVLRRHLPADDPMRPYAERLEAPGLGDQLLRGYLSGSIDVVLRVGEGAEQRFVVVDYKTNRLGEPGAPITALDYAPAALDAAMLHSHYPLQALLYSVVLHRYLRWRLLGYDPEVHLGGVLYLYLRGLCGPETPRVDGVPCGVFSWRPPAALVVELSELLDGRPDPVPTPGGAR